MLPKARFKNSHRNYEIDEIASNGTRPLRAVIPREQLAEYQRVSEWIESITDNSPYISGAKAPF